MDAFLEFKSVVGFIRQLADAVMNRLLQGQILCFESIKPILSKSASKTLIEIPVIKSQEVVLLTPGILSQYTDYKCLEYIQYTITNLATIQLLNGDF